MDKEVINKDNADIIIYYYLVFTGVYFLIYFILAIILIYKIQKIPYIFYFILFFIFTIFIQNITIYYYLFKQSYKEGWHNSQCGILYGEYAKNQYKIDQIDKKYNELKAKIKVLRVDANKYKNIQKNLQTLNYSTNRIYNKKTNKMIIR
jgi:energy-coupling factor transporter transmembrane protein EcfT